MPKGLSDEDVVAIRLNYNASNPTWSVMGISRRYGVSTLTVKRALLGASYKHIPGALNELGYQSIQGAQQCQ